MKHLLAFTLVLGMAGCDTPSPQDELCASMHSLSQKIDIVACQSRSQDALITEFKSMTEELSALNNKQVDNVIRAHQDKLIRAAGDGLNCTTGAGL